MRLAPPRLGAIIVGSVVSLLGCGSGSYPMPTEAGGAQYNPASLGQAIPAVVLFIQLRPGDRIELLGAEPVGVGDGATVEFFYSPPVALPDGTMSIGEKLEPLVGAVWSSPAEPSPSTRDAFGIVARMTASKPGRYELIAVRLRYRLNGGTEQTREGIDVEFTICADDPKPEDCTEPTEDPAGG